MWDYGTRNHTRKVLGYRAVSPIFVRPVREQLEHDRLIRYLVTRYKRKIEAVANVGDEQIAPVKLGIGTYYPDIVLMEGKKLAGVVEVETAESVNNLEAMAQWVPFSKSRVPFHLYVPVHTYDVARRFCESHQAAVTEIWTYRPAADGFDLVRLFHDAAAPGRRLAKSLGGPAKALPLNTVPVKAEAKPPATSGAKTDSNGLPKVPPKPAAKADTKPPVKAGLAAPKPVAKAGAKAEAKTPAKAGARPDTKTPAKASAKPVGKVGPKPPAKPVAKAGPKTETKSPAKAAKAPAKPAAPKPTAKSPAKAGKR